MRQYVSFTGSQDHTASIANHDGCHACSKLGCGNTNREAAYPSRARPVHLHAFMTFATRQPGRGPFPGMRGRQQHLRISPANLALSMQHDIHGCLLLVERGPWGKVWNVCIPRRSCMESIWQLQADLGSQGIQTVHATQPWTDSRHGTACRVFLRNRPRLESDHSVG
jgi:hypothetical protein